MVAVPRNAWTQAPADSAGLLVDAHDYYGAFYRAALGAKRYILMSGWQFDSKVEVLRGEQVGMAAAAGGETRLIGFLNHLCETRPELEINILAWDFHMVFALEREWMQSLLFHWKTHERLRFLFDDQHPPGGCHHQKMVLIDGVTAFTGGIDICESRWDNRCHREKNELRVSRGMMDQKPYHDVQAFVTGERAVAPLVELFVDRWQRASGEVLSLPKVPDAAPMPMPAAALRLPAGRVAYSQTDPCAAGRGSAREIATLLCDAIDAAESLVYLETQYFSSREIREVLERRMRAVDRPRLQMVLVLNQRAEAFKEQLAVGLRQAENVGRLRRLAAETGHALGVYFVVARSTVTGKREDEPPSTYIHTKLSIVDDDFLSIGSANLTNRSLGLDTELNLTWDVASHEDPAALGRAIRRIRVSLLAEHAALDGVAVRALVRVEGLVERLDALAASVRTGLRLHPSPTESESEALAVLDPQQLPFDDAHPDGAPESGREEHRSLLRVGLGDLLPGIG